MGYFAFAAFFPLVPLSLGDRKNSFSHLFFFSFPTRYSLQRNPRGEMLDLSFFRQEKKKPGDINLVFSFFFCLPLDDCRKSTVTGS